MTVSSVRNTDWISGWAWGPGEVENMSDMRAVAQTSKAWPFEEARRILKRYEKAPPEKG